MTPKLSSSSESSELSELFLALPKASANGDLVDNIFGFFFVGVIEGTSFDSVGFVSGASTRRFRLSGCKRFF